MTSDSLHILVVDDDARLRALLQRYLVQNGYLVSVAADAGEARRALSHIQFDLIVLDVMLPDKDGIELTGELRRELDVPILLLTARGEPEDRIAGLERGADDYLVKPFEPRELLLRVTTILRRVRPSRGAAPGGSGVVRFGPFSFDPDALELRRGEEPINLTNGEAALLRILCMQPDQPISRAELGARSRISGSDRAVDVQIVRLRRKIEDDSKQPRYLLTMRGAGYVLRTKG
ncbi:response regulator [Marinimicrococcus flavescens]|uniref:Response regulator n=1 Tax=Marinimicrococcus flavescens TaxID=3031815 RepID=A0AAP3V1R2_9PROT|nr:response regulator [Marinimicrococcus flavescens]